MAFEYIRESEFIMQFFTKITYKTIFHLSLIIFSVDLYLLKTTFEIYTNSITFVKGFLTLKFLTWYLYEQFYYF